MTVPCKDCRYRKQGCHGNCDEYKEFQNLKNEINVKLIKESIFKDYLHSNLKRPKRRKGAMKV